MKLATIVLLFLTGCATITRGPHETIRVDSKPGGANASIKCDGGVDVSGTTPAKLVIPRRADHCMVTVTDGTRTKQRALDRGPGGMYWANFGMLGAVSVGALISWGSDDDTAVNAGAAISAAGALGFLVDWATGSMYDRDVHDVVIDLASDR